MFAKIIHQHIHKTAGTSINCWLDLLAPAERVRPADHESRFFSSRLGGQTLGILPEIPRALHAELGRESLAYWDVLHGHSCGLALRHPSAYRFVILRDPTTRLLSFLRDWRRFQLDEVEAMLGEKGQWRRDALRLDASAFIAVHAATPSFRRLSQAHALLEAAALALPEAALRSTGLELARFALDELFDTVGVFEDLSSIVRSIARGVGAAPPVELGRANAGRADPSLDALSPEAQAMLREAWADDYVLHEHAARLARRFAAPDYDEATFESDHLMARLEQLAPRYTGWGRGWTVNDQIVGSGFHGREAANTSNVQAWTGPGTRSVIYVPVPLDEWLDLFVDVMGFIDPRVRDSLRMRVDGREVAFARRPAKGIAERLWIRVGTVRPFLKLEIVVDRTYSPDELGFAGGDRRRLGLAVRGYGFRIVPGIDHAADTWPLDPLPVLGLSDAHRDGEHPEHDWAVAFARLALAPDRSEAEVLAYVTCGINARDLQAEITVSGVGEAFRRVLRRPAPQEWIDFWVGKRSLTLHRLYQELVRGEEFRQLRQRLL
jgi:hypothetical protein